MASTTPAALKLSGLILSSHMIFDTYLLPNTSATLIVAIRYGLLTFDGLSTGSAGSAHGLMWLSFGVWRLAFKAHFYYRLRLLIDPLLRRLETVVFRSGCTRQPLDNPVLHESNDKKGKKENGFTYEVARAFFFLHKPFHLDFTPGFWLFANDLPRHSGAASSERVAT
ncbi:hypothetical protein F5Y06DRAFT_133788 [Hypoxylon sp. FL0890]|nr:hypothetical protein F5Y06DRAFT_133788 [Hypoxylon sp. FL0890]